MCYQNGVPDSDRSPLGQVYRGMTTGDQNPKTPAAATANTPAQIGQRGLASDPAQRASTPAPGNAANPFRTDLAISTGGSVGGVHGTGAGLNIPV